MKTSKNRAPVETPAAPQAWAPKWWHYAIGFAALFFVAFEIYGPALAGPFVFDDVYLPFFNPNLVNQPLRIWANVRPLLMASYWLNYQMSGIEPYTYHWVNVFLHALNAALAFALVRKFLALAGEASWMREVLSVFAAALFLLHPLQTESVAYIASRSEVLSILFFFCALAVFLYRRHSAISIPIVIAVLVLFALAFLTKEHTAVLPAFLLLTDYFWNPGFKFDGVKRNWKLYIPIMAGGVLAVIAVFAVLKHSDSAGFKLQDLQWYQYLFTQFRSIWAYIGLYILPVWQNVDHDLAISKTIFDHGSIFYLLGLLALATLAWKFRRQYPLASFGYFGFLTLLAPTSSVIPIQDVLVERRAYLPFLCLLLITVEFLRRWKFGRGSLIATLGVVLIAAGFLSHQRNELWASPVALWQDAVNKSPNRSRPHFQLAFAEMQAGQCQAAIQQYEAVAKLDRLESRLLVDWALAEDCALKTDGAITRLKQAAQLEPNAHVYSLLGMMYGKQGKVAESLEALATGEKMNPNYEMIFVYRGNDYFTMGQYARAAEEFKRALAIDPQNQGAANGLLLVQKQLRAKP